MSSDTVVDGRHQIMLAQLAAAPILTPRAA